jgi:hypothetical protein
MRNHHRFLPGLIPLLAFAGAMYPSAATAQAVFEQTSEIGISSVAPPAEYAFTAATSQALTVTLTDFQAPAAFTSLQIAVTLGDALVGMATLQSGSTTATVSVPAASGNYGLHVIGTPNATQGLGSFGVCVAPAGNATACIAADSFSGNIQTPSGPSSTGSATLNTNFTSTVAGSYTVTLTDDAFPVALSSVSAGIALGSSFLAVNIPTGSTQVTLAAGTSYTLLVAAVADSTVLAGLYGIQITDPNGHAVFARTLPVGEMSSPTTVSNPSAQMLQMTLSDLAYPAPLASLGVAITSGAVSLTPPLTAAGTSLGFDAPAGDLSLWQYAVATSQPGVYSLVLATGSANLYSTTQVAEPSSVSTATSFAFVVNAPSAGPYTVAVNDFQFPVQLQSLSYTVAQAGTPLATGANGGFTASAGPMVVLVDATASTGGSGIFSVTVAQSGSSTLLLDQTQAVGGVFSSNVVNIGAAGTYDVTLADLGFPATFQNLNVVVSSAGQVVGKIYTSGSFPVNATPGQYLITFVATPGAQNYGLYSIDIAAAAPTVTLSASATSVTVGQPVQLTWSSQNATSCTASGSTAWSGTEQTTGSAGVTIQASVTLTLTCTGPGGSSSQSVSVAAVPATTSSSGGGGGALDAATLGMLAALAGLVASRRRPGQKADRPVNSRPTASW